MKTKSVEYVKTQKVNVSAEKYNDQNSGLFANLSLYFSSRLAERRVHCLHRTDPSLLLAAERWKKKDDQHQRVGSGRVLSSL
jgi:hypothetical protein